MKRINSLFFAGYLLLNCSLFSMSWGQRILQPVSSTDPVSLSVEGSIIDIATRKPVAGANIVAKNQTGTINARQRVGDDGAFKLILRSKEAFVLSVDASDYEPFEKQIAPTSKYTNKISNDIITLYRTGTKPASTTTAVATAVAPVHKTTSTITAAPVTTSPVSEQPTSGSAAITSNARVTPPKTLDAKVVYTPPLVVAATGKTTQLRAIQFVQSKPELLPDAIPALEQLLQFLQGKPAAEIELSGHTDNQGDFDENVRLSKQRVDVVKEYLVKNGIAANRITTRGYGPTRPIASNTTETTRQLNRRVEMIVVKQ